MNYNDEYPTEIKLLKKITKNDQLFYAYSMIYENSEKEESSYIAVVGPCKKVKQENTFKRYKVHTDWELIKEDWEGQATDLIPQLNEIVSD